MPSEHENQQPSFPKTLGQILEALPSAQNSDSTSNQQLPNLSITGKAVAKHALTGNLPSATVLDNLRNIALNVSKGQLLDDQTLLTSLAQHFGSRLVAKKKYEPIYEKEGGYDEAFKGYQVSLDRLDDSEMKFFDALDFYNKKASFEFVTAKVAKMRLIMARRNESNQDIEMLCVAYTDYLQKYPPDVVNSVVENIIKTKKFFPLISELIPALEELTCLRKAIITAFERLRNPLYQKLIA
jgi:hypothetical protein